MQKYNMQYQKAYILVPALWGVTLLYLLPVFGSGFSPDSYAYYFIGKHLVSGQGYWSPAIRENMPHASFHSRTFPPLYPLLCGLTDVFFKTRIYSGVLVNVVALYGLFHYCHKIASALGGGVAYSLLFALFFFVLTDEPFLYETISACSIPFATFLLTVILYRSIRATAPGRKAYCMIGALLGLLYLTRFDTTLFCLLFPLALRIARKDSSSSCIPAYAAFLAVISPWLACNALEWGNPFSANQSTLVFSVFDGNPVLSFFKDASPPTVFSAPVLWLKQRFLCAVFNLLLIYTLLIPSNLPPILHQSTVQLGPLLVPVYFTLVSLAGGALILGLVLYGAAKAPLETRRLVLFSLFWGILNLATISLSRFSDIRYFCATMLLLLLSAAATAICLKWKSITPLALPLQTSLHPALACASSLFIACALWAASPYMQRDNHAQDYYALYNDFRSMIPGGTLVGCKIHADNIAYYSGWKTIYVPYNTHSPDGNFIAWKEHFKVDYIIVDDDFTFSGNARIKLLATSGKWKLLDVHAL